MKVDRLNDNWNKVSTKKELVESLKKYRGILNNQMIDYLNSLIELDFSVIKEYIKEEDRKSLAELEIYKKIAIYNIYNRALNLFNKNNIEHNFLGNDDGFDSLSISVPLNDHKEVKVFDFDYKDFYSKSWSKIPDEFITMVIGNISLYQTLESKELREAELNRVINKLDKLYDASNPYPSSFGIAGGPNSQWNYRHAQEIAKYEDMFIKLDSKNKLNDMEQKEIEITNQINNLFLDDYGLTNSSFVEEASVNSFFKNEKSVLKKTLTKRQANLTIKNNIKYI